MHVHPPRRNPGLVPAAPRRRAQRNDRVERLADLLLEGIGGTVRLTGHGPGAAVSATGIRLRDGRLVATLEICYSTPELLALEQRIVHADDWLHSETLALLRRLPEPRHVTRIP